MIISCIMSILVLCLAASLAQLRYEAGPLLWEARSLAFVVGTDVRCYAGKSCKTRKGSPRATGGRRRALGLQLGPELTDVPRRHYVRLK